jgi:hypothetical protein
VPTGVNHGRGYLSLSVEYTRSGHVAAHLGHCVTTAGDNGPRSLCSGL